MDFSTRLDFVHKAQLLGESLMSTARHVPLRTATAAGFLARSTVALGSVATLFEAGRELDARSVSRTIAELAIDLRWILSAPDDERIEKFLEYSIVVSHRREQSIATSRGLSEKRSAQKQAAADAAGLTLEEFSASRQADYHRVKDNYPKATSWAKEDLFTRSKLAGLDALYESVFKAGCDALHSSPTTIDEVMRELPDGTLELDFGPRPPKNDQALYGAVWAYLHVLESCIDLLAPDREPELKEFLGEYLRVFEVDLSLQREPIPTS